MARMRAMVVREAGGEIELEEREVPDPGRGEALVKVQACGVCHSDSFATAEAYDTMLDGDARFRMVLQVAA